MTEFKWTDYNCEGCGIYKMLKKRETDGKLLCKKCSNNQALGMFKSNSAESGRKN